MQEPLLEMHNFTDYSQVAPPRYTAGMYIQQMFISILSYSNMMRWSYRTLTSWLQFFLSRHQLIYDIIRLSLSDKTYGILYFELFIASAWCLHSSYHVLWNTEKYKWVQNLWERNLLSLMLHNWEFYLMCIKFWTPNVFNDGSCHYSDGLPFNWINIIG